MNAELYDMIYNNPKSGSSVVDHFPETDEQVTEILIRTNESVTPGYLAWRIAQACAGSVLREGESVEADGLVFTVSSRVDITWHPE